MDKLEKVRVYDELYNSMLHLQKEKQEQYSSENELFSDSDEWLNCEIPCTVSNEVSTVTSCTSASSSSKVWSEQGAAPDIKQACTNSDLNDIVERPGYEDGSIVEDGGHIESNNEAYECSIAPVLDTQSRIQHQPCARGDALVTSNGHQPALHGDNSQFPLSDEYVPHGKYRHDEQQHACRAQRYAQESNPTSECGRPIYNKSRNHPMVYESNPSFLGMHEQQFNGSQCFPGQLQYSSIPPHMVPHIPNVNLNYMGLTQNNTPANRSKFQENQVKYSVSSTEAQCRHVRQLHSSFGTQQLSRRDKINTSDSTFPFGNYQKNAGQSATYSNYKTKDEFQEFNQSALVPANNVKQQRNAGQNMWKEYSSDKNVITGIEGLSDNEEIIDRGSISRNKNIFGRNSIRSMIRYAILTSPNKRLLLREIYEYFIREIPSFRDTKNEKFVNSWKNMVRHNLSKYDMFKKIKNGSMLNAHFWIVDDNCNGATDHQKSFCERYCNEQVALGAHDLLNNAARQPDVQYNPLYELPPESGNLHQPAPYMVNKRYSTNLRFPFEQTQQYVINTRNNSNTGNDASFTAGMSGMRYQAQNDG